MTNNKLQLKVRTHKGLFRFAPEVGSGVLQNLAYKLHALVKAKKLGLKTHKMGTSENGQVEILVEGEKTKLWEMIKWSKNGNFFARIKEVTFQFNPRN